MEMRREGFNQLNKTRFVGTNIFPAPILELRMWDHNPDVVNNDS
jgi:hypothetical protein